MEDQEILTVEERKMKTLTTSEVYAKAVKANNQFAKIETIESKFDSSIVEICKKIRSRANKSETTVKQFCDNLITNKLKEIAKALPDEGYSMGSYVNVKCGKFSAQDDRTQDYSKSCKYRPTYGRVDFKLSPVDFRHTKVIGGVVTLIHPDQKSKVKTCDWIEGKGLKQHFHLETVRGYIYAGFHSTTKDGAKKGCEEYLSHLKEQAQKVANFAKALRLRYSFADSIKCGNCEAGTKAFALRCGLDESKKYRGSYLLKIAKEKSTSTVSFVERMVNSKVKR